MKVHYVVKPMLLLPKNFSGPEKPLLTDIFTEVMDDVRFLEEAHGV